jgi:hypothetical protein
MVKGRLNAYNSNNVKQIIMMEAGNFAREKCKGAINFHI